MTTTERDSGQVQFQSARVLTESPEVAVLRMAGGFVTTQVLYAAVNTGIPDCIGDHARSAAEVADGLGLDGDALERFLRMMTVLGLLTESDEGRFALTEAGQLLCATHPNSMRERILYICAVNYPAAVAAPHSLRTGKPAFDHVFGMSFFEYLALHPHLSRAFQGLMQGNVEQRIAGVLNAYDFSYAKYIVDIGGGNGSLLAAILGQATGARGAILDIPAVIALAREHLADTMVASRIKLIEGDLLSGPYPAGADIYLLSNIIHDWNDDVAGIILGHCAAAMRPDSILLLLEEIMPTRVLDAPSTIANDYSMLLLTGGRERSEDDYRRLMKRCNLTLSTVIPFVTASDRNLRRRGSWAMLCCHER